MNDSLYTEDIEIALNYVLISCYIIIITIEIPWIIYFFAKMVEMNKSVSDMDRRRNEWDNTSKQIYQQHKNKLRLYFYLFIVTIAESLTTFSILLTLLIIFDLLNPTINCNEFYFLFYLYIKYNLLSLSVILPQCTIELINITSLYVNYIFLRNSSTVSLTQRINRFTFKQVLVVTLALSGIGLPLAFIISETLLIIGMIQYYKYSKQVYRSLTMIADDLLYEHSRSSLEATRARRQLVHYKRFTIWFYIFSLILVFVSIDFVLWLPQSVMEETCIVSNVAQFVDSDVYQVYKYALLAIGGVLHVSAIIVFLPFYTVYSLYYLCDKFLFTYKYPHRYKIRYSANMDLEDRLEFVA